MKHGRMMQTAVAALFSLLISAPLLLGVFGIGGSTASIEKRELAQRPEISLLFRSWKDYTAGFERYYNDSFALREKLIRWNNLARLKVFGESPIRGVRVGRDGWFFYNKEWAFEDFENAIPYKPKDLEAIARNLEERRAWLECRGIKLFVVIPPNKHTIYPEYLPPYIKKLGDRSRLDQLSELLMKHPSFEFIDLRPALLEAKGRARLYHRTDSHWNDYGAFVGYRELMDRVARTYPDVKRLSLDDFTVQVQMKPGGDLAGMLSLSDVIGEEEISLVPGFEPRAVDGVRDYEDPVKNPGRAMVVKETGDPSLPKALIFRDSYSWALIPFISESFQSSVYIWTHEFLPDIIEREKPDVVILEIVERYQYSLLIDNPEEVKAGCKGRIGGASGVNKACASSPMAKKDSK